ncbi:hypothetical protein, partial [Enterovibrio nigricans]|uniref:hypothetical protein n=1 Tax=Enterovibrio nigricans TaxID=504469 RepID=UPI001BAF7D5A
MSRYCGGVGVKIAEGGVWRKAIHYKGQGIETFTSLKENLCWNGVVAKNSIGRISPRRFLKLRVNYLDIKESIHEGGSLPHK